ncbi:MAG: msrBA [Myxococcales bacterium]|nr:msrBA [Myxococcales bacterium]
MLVMRPRLVVALLGTALVATCTPSDANPTKRAATKDGPREVAILAAGCFWGVEHWMMKADGVVDAEVGYIGGPSAKVSYEQVAGGSTGHAEAVRIVFDPSVISYEDLLSKWFFRIHDPTTLNRQGNDDGSQYRSAIFPTSDAQRAAAHKIKDLVARSGKWKGSITTTIEAPTHWVKAEGYHQDYLVKNPGGYDNHWLRPFSY